MHAVDRFGHFAVPDYPLRTLDCRKWAPPDQMHDMFILFDRQELAFGH